MPPAMHFCSVMPFQCLTVSLLHPPNNLTLGLVMMLPIVHPYILLHVHSCPPSLLAKSYPGILTILPATYAIPLS